MNKHDRHTAIRELLTSAPAGNGNGARPSKGVAGGRRAGGGPGAVNNQGILSKGSLSKEILSQEILSQEILRQKLAERGFLVTQATLSRDIRELHLLKGPGGYALPTPNQDDNDAAPSLVDTLANFGLRVRQAQNQVLVITTMGGAQPVAAAIDHEGMPEVVGTIAGDDTVLVICPDTKYATRLRERLAVWVG